MRKLFTAAMLLAGCVTLPAGWIASAAAQATEPVAATRLGPAPLARLDVLDRGHGPEAWAENLLAGPIEVVLRASGNAPVAYPPLPARATVPSRGRVLVSRVDRADALLLLDVVPGHPGAKPRDVEYAWPLATHVLSIGQGWGGAFSHRDDENRHAVDFAVAEGTPVLAARDGVVMQVEARFSNGSLDSPADTDRANFIRILHDDGTMAVYAHLAPGGARVRQGQRVRRGQRIGTSGSTGYSGGPHLHFAIQANRGMRLASLPFKMFGPAGILRFSEADQAKAMGSFSP